MESSITRGTTRPATRRQKRTVNEVEKSRKRFAAEQDYVGPNDIVIQPDTTVKVEIKEEPIVDENEVEGRGAIITIHDQPSFTVKDIICEDELGASGQLACVQEDVQSQDSNTSRLGDQTVEGQVKSSLKKEVASTLNSNGAIIALQSECNRFGIDISRIPKMEAVSVEETYRLRLETLVAAKKLEELENRRATEVAAKGREIQDLELRRSQEISVKDREIQELKEIRFQENAENERKIRDLELNMTENIAAKDTEIQEQTINLEHLKAEIRNQNMEILNLEKTLLNAEKKEEEFKHLELQRAEKSAAQESVIKTLRNEQNINESQIALLRMKLYDLRKRKNPGASNLN